MSDEPSREQAMPDAGAGTDVRNGTAQDDGATAIEASPAEPGRDGGAHYRQDATPDEVDARAPVEPSSDGGTCIPMDVVEYGPFECSQLDVMRVVDPVLTDESGDGRISPGETATLDVLLREIAGIGFVHYPGVTVTADDPRVEAQADAWYYAILPCQEYDSPTTLSFAPTIPVGTEVRITASVASLNEECPDAPSITIDIVVGE